MKPLAEILKPESDAGMKSLKGRAPEIMLAGHDGFPPEFPEVRDVAGAGKRSIKGILNINCDRLGYLLAHRRISESQHDAGRRLQADAELAQIGGFATASETTAGGNGYAGLSDTKLDAQARHGAALRVLGRSGRHIVELVVISGHSLAQVEVMMRFPVGGGIGALTVALDLLSDHYGLTTHSKA